MGFYQEKIVPHLVNLAMRNGDLTPYRERVLAGAQGHVLEIGVGSGANLPLYSGGVIQLLALEPSPKLIAMARGAASRSARCVKFIEGSAESIPLASHSVDTVVMTWTLCSIPQASQALGEIRRVLKPDGSLLFVEHGLSPEPHIKRWQDRLNPYWKRFAGGCNLNRNIPSLLQDAGFRVIHLNTGYMKGPKPFTYLYEGSASPA
jgi:ubiquinone/menaquinone biosynthesis C-methylase UbiE